MKKDTNSIFAKNLNRLMAEKKITVEKASQIADVSKSNIVSWRSGVAPTNFEAVKKLAELFGVSFSFLLTGAEESSSDKKIATVTEVFKEGDLLFDGFSAKMQKLVLSDNPDIVEACDFMIAEKNKVSRQLESLNEEKTELENKKVHVKQVVDDQTAEKWIKKTMASFYK